MENGVGRWRWAVLAAAFFNMVVNASMSYHLGVLNIAIVRAFSPDHQVGAWLLSLYGATFALAAPLGSIVINATSCRFCVFLSGLVSFLGFVSSSFAISVEWLFVTLTLAGIGQSLSQVGGTVILPYYFPKMASIANGICIAGAGLGSFIHPPLLQGLLDSYGLRGSFLVLGSVSLNSCVAGLIFRPTQREVKRKMQHKTKTEQTKTLLERFCDHLDIFRIPAFTAIFVAIFTFSVGFMAVLVFLPEYLVDIKGLSRQEASIVASVMGGSSVVARALVGIAAADPAIGEVILFTGMCAISSVICLSAKIWFSFHLGVYIFSSAFGIYASAAQALQNPFIFNILGLEKAASGFGLILLAFGCGSLVGPPLSAQLAESFPHSVLFYFAGLMFMMTSIFAIVPSVFHKSSKTANGTPAGAGDFPTTHEDTVDLEITKCLKDPLLFGSTYEIIIDPAKCEYECDETYGSHI